MYATQKAIDDVLKRLEQYKYRLNTNDLWLEIVDQVTAEVEKELFRIVAPINDAKPKSEG